MIIKTITKVKEEKRVIRIISFVIAYVTLISITIAGTILHYRLMGKKAAIINLLYDIAIITAYTLINIFVI